MKKKNRIVRIIALVVVFAITTPSANAQSYEMIGVGRERIEIWNSEYEDVELYKVVFADSTVGYVCFSLEYETWYVYPAENNTWGFKSRSDVLNALYTYSKRQSRCETIERK